MTRLHTYVVVTDLGIAPNPFHGVCTLAVCKPVIRRTARVGDWILGTGSKARGLQGRAVYAMQVAEILDFEAYWHDPRFHAKRPDPAGSPSRQAGDNLHWFDSSDGGLEHRARRVPQRRGTAPATCRGLQVLIGWDFVYWGSEGPPVPPCADVDVVCRGRGHRNHFPTEAVDAFATWVRATGLSGRVGWPLTWGPDTQAKETAARGCGSHSPPLGQVQHPTACSAASRQSRNLGFGRLRSEVRRCSARIMLKAPVQYACTGSNRSLRLCQWETGNTIVGCSNQNTSQVPVVSRFEIVGVAVVGMTCGSQKLAASADRTHPGNRPSASPVLASGPVDGLDTPNRTSNRVQTKAAKVSETETAPYKTRLPEHGIIACHEAPSGPASQPGSLCRHSPDRGALCGQDAMVPATAGGSGRRGCTRC